MMNAVRRIHQHCLVAAVACLATLPAFAQRGAITLPRNLDTIVITLHVSETLKGAVRDTYTFRQYIWDLRDRDDVAGYRKGQELLLLMNGSSRYGLTSPVGLEQGRFRIQRDRSGREVATNGTGNLRLFERLEYGPGKPAALTERQSSLVAKHRGGPVALDELEAMIRAYAGNE